MEVVLIITIIIIKKYEGIYFIAIHGFSHDEDYNQNQLQQNHPKGELRESLGIWCQSRQWGNLPDHG